MNGKYELRRELGEGKTSKVYLANDLEVANQKYAIKILKNEYIENDEKAQDQVIKEVAVLETLKHGNIVGIYDYGDDGKIVKASGKVKENVVYIVLEYIAGGLLFEVCQDLGPLGEDCARVFFKEIV
jgi:serine/threonine protein kinase